MQAPARSGAVKGLYALAFVVATLTALPCWGEVPLDAYDSVKFKPWFRSYLHGVGTGLSWANTISASEARQRLFCVPQDLRLLPEHYIRILEREVRDARRVDGNTSSETAIELLLLRGLQREFPCGAKVVRHAWH